MKYILDTNVLSAVRRADRGAKVRAWLAAQKDENLFLSVITIGEIARGIRQQERRDPTFCVELQTWLNRTQLLFSDRILPFSASDALVWGRLSADLGHNGADLMIAATALNHDATVVTGNVSDFAPTLVRVENPF